MQLVRKRSAWHIWIIVLGGSVTYVILLLDSHKPFSHYEKLPFGYKVHAGPDKYFVNPNITRSQYTLSPDECDHIEPAFLMIAIISAPRNFRTREMIRKTWASVAASCKVRFMFVLGRVHSHTTQQSLAREAKQYGDLLQSNQYDDTFRSSTTKTLHLFQWCAAFCSSSTFVIRVDDDAYLNIPKLHDILKSGDRDAFYGNVFMKEIQNDEWLPERNPNGKYYSPREEYKHDRYPVYIWGFLIIAPTSQLGKVLYASQFIPYSFIDDIYITGLIANFSGIPLRHLPSIIATKTKAMTISAPCFKNMYAALHRITTKDLFIMWHAECTQNRNVCK